MARKALTITALSLAMALALLAMAWPASAGNFGVSVKVAKEKGGTYKNVLRINVADGRSKSAWFRVKGKQNPEQLDLLFSDEGSSSSLEGLKVKWFKHGDNATEQVQGSGYPFHVDPGQSKYFQARVKADDPAGDACIEGDATDGISVFESAAVGINEACPN